MRAEGFKPSNQELKAHDKIGKKPVKIAVFAGIKTATKIESLGDSQ